ncbi:MAG: hypothetical protein Q4C73_03175 [Eubacteriales bacterium]|nr:hypothetical protein [Eubacteriales bacterium]
MIADAIRQAQRMHKAVLEQTYDGVCSIYALAYEKDPETRVSKHKETLLQGELPCHLSFSGSPAAKNSETVTTAAQTIKLFLAPEQVIPPGSRIEVTQNGRTESYAQSGKAAVYTSHQEIVLELWKGYC